MESRFFNIREVAEYLGVEVSTIYGWAHTRQIPYYKIGRLLKFKLDEIDKWANETKVEVLNYD